jgi:crotonobetainyl-CoA:carnitine CoA-transferase CaiB-like acyl-CoA transferase
MVVIHLSSLDKFWDELVSAFEAPQLKADPRFQTRMSRVEHFDALHAEFEAITLQKTRAEWVAIMDNRDVPFSAVNSIEDAANDPQAKALELIVPVEKDGPDAADRAVRPAAVFDGQRTTTVKPAPRLDADGQAIRLALTQNLGWPSTTPARTINRDAA